METQLVYSKLNLLPDNLKSEVLDFIDFLLSKTNKIEKPNPAKFGSGKGMFIMKDDFDEPLEDFKEYMPEPNE